MESAILVIGESDVLSGGKGYPRAQGRSERLLTEDPIEHFGVLAAQASILHTPVQMLPLGCPLSGYRYAPDGVVCPVAALAH